MILQCYFSRGINYSSNHILIGLHKSIKLFHVKDCSTSSDSGSSSGSSESDLDNNVLKSKKNVDIERRKNYEAKDEYKSTIENLNRLLDLFTKKNTNSKISSITYLAKKVELKHSETEKNYNNKSFEKKLKDAVNDIATSIGDDTNKIKSELLNKIENQNKKNVNQFKDPSTQESTISLSDILANMKVFKQTKMSKYSNQDKIRTLSLENKGVFKQSNLPIINLNSYVEKHIHFFDVLPVKNIKNDVNLSTWNVLENRELKLLVIDTPQNIFQEMIEWTEKGMIWKFPINNEQGIEEEEKIHFSEHIFLERHLQDWCPKKGPLRHFMDLVCVGLSKNAFMTVNEKIEHIIWYKNYFEDKKELLIGSEYLDNKIIDAN